MKTVVIVQARMSSRRLPGKVMKPLVGNEPMIGILLSRLSLSKKIDQIIVAASTNSADKPLCSYVEDLGYICFTGSEEDVLDRFYQTSKAVNAEVIIRITADCPLVDPILVDNIINEFSSSSVDYVSNVNPPFFPDGLDIEVFSFSALKLAWQESCVPQDREHVTPYIRNSGKFKTKSISYERDLSHIRLTVDEEEDLKVVRSIFEFFHPKIDFSWEKVIEIFEKHPSRFILNNRLKRNEGMFMGNGQKLWKRAKNIIPGGNMLLSKRPEIFLPEVWPSYFERAKGCKVWDLDGNEYVDMFLMGVGTNVLGYGHPEVDEAVVSTIKKGNMSSLNCPEEVYLAERLVDLHPWADMVKFARSGGEANAISIRIARAATNKSKVAICGYHGWHDWYLSANLGNTEGLSGHLLPGLSPEGVPSNLQATTFPFNYNNFSEIEALVQKEDIGIIKMEVVRNKLPENDFLHKIRELATKNNIVLIFDECTSGFRQSFGGIHKIYNVEPDIAIFGKTLGNGYGITAVVGRREVMEAAQKTFISSTFWSERIGPSAALKTLEVMERLKSWEIITSRGLEIEEGWKILARNKGLSIDIFGVPALISFTFNSPKHLEYKTLITQEMLKKGILAGTSVYTCIDHTKEILDLYFYELEKVFDKIKACEEGESINAFLTNPVCQTGFKRLN